MLPKWAKDNRTAVLEEAAPYVGMSDEQRLEVLRSVLRAGARQLAMHSERERLMEFRDPLPKSSIEALARLRRDRKVGADGRAAR
ncbi:MAG: hypothetical protein JNK82_03510 [Myxococcaceae bacterium]|nr:hypothetical protein [Myxococcaceae bacterium]